MQAAGAPGPASLSVPVSTPCNGVLETVEQPRIPSRLLKSAKFRD
jgi:hypothetical protein